MFSLCGSSKSAPKDEKTLLKKFDRNNNGEVTKEELAKLNLNTIHKELFGSDSEYKANSYFKQIDEENLFFALDRNKDDIIDITDFHSISTQKRVTENTFGLLELIALNDAYGEAKDAKNAKAEIISNYRGYYTFMAEQQLKNQKLFNELFYVKSIVSPMPTTSYA